MEVRLVKFGHKLHFSLEMVEVVQGVNSKIDDNTHFLMWDFDGIEIEDLTHNLLEIQHKYSLPTIRVLKTQNGYHAYCFHACTWVEARTIIAATQGIDEKYAGIGLMRGYFTLRYDSEEMKPCLILQSIVPETVTYSDVCSFVNYTKVKHGKTT